MFDSIRRARLQRQGLSCGKTRRKQQEGDLFDEMRTHFAVTLVVYGLFFTGLAILLRVGCTLAEGVPPPDFLDWLSVGAIVIALVVHQRVALQDEMAENATLLLVLGTLLLHLVLGAIVIDFGDNQGWPPALLGMAVPHVFAPLVLSVMLGRKIGLFGAIYSTLLGSLVFGGFLNPITYLATSSLLGFLAVAFTNRVRKRNRLFSAGLYAGLAAAVFSLMLHEASGLMDSVKVTRMTGIPFLIGILTGMVVGGFLPVLEQLFGVTTEVSWLELADLNHPLMRRLSIEAPGTYHHSLVVANLSEAAAETIGASATMCRVSSYFHDIGKLSKPEYFIENMNPSVNPHEDLTARMSALVIIAHVKDGVDLAIKHNLNSRIIDVIEQHHGTSLAWYFYRQALDQKAKMLRLVEQDKAKEDDVPQVSEEVFRYPGSKPHFKEAAIISLADAVESASRTLDKPNASRIETMVNEIVQARMLDGQLDECDLTIAQLAKVKASFCKTLLSMMHGRIKYQKVMEAAPTTMIQRDDPHPILVVPAEPPMTASMKIVEASFAGPEAEASVKKRSRRKTPPASAA
ncbi:MAG: HD family phosphohydrolase [Prosthecobacter sp.]